MREVISSPVTRSRTVSPSGFGMRIAAPSAVNTGCESTAIAKARRSRPVIRSQTRTVQSAPVVSNVRPSGASSSDRTAAVCPVGSCSGRNVTAFHKRMKPSAEAVAIRLPSDDTPTALTRAWWPRSRARSFSIAKSRTTGTPSSPMRIPRVLSGMLVALQRTRVPGRRVSTVAAKSRPFATSQREVFARLSSRTTREVSSAPSCEKCSSETVPPARNLVSPRRIEAPEGSSSPRSVAAGSVAAINTNPNRYDMANPIRGCPTSRDRNGEWRTAARGSDSEPRLTRFGPHC